MYLIVKSMLRATTYPKCKRIDSKPMICNIVFLESIKLKFQTLQKLKKFYTINFVHVDPDIT